MECAQLCCPLQGLWGSEHFNFSLRFPGDYKRKDGIRIQFDQNLVFVMIFKSSMNKIAIYIKIRIIKCVYNLPGLWSTWQIFIHDWVNSHHPLLTSTRPLDSIHRFLFFVSVLTVGGKHCIKQCGDLLKHRFTELMHSSFV